MNIIGIHGQIGSGKDTFAEFLASLSSTPVERHAFADKLREVTELITGAKMTKMDELPFFNTVYNYTQEQKNQYLPAWDRTIGRCLQVIGTDSLRDNFDYNVWVKSLFETVGRQCIDSKHVLVIPDVRFPNEADYILDQGGIVLKITGDPMDVRKNSNRDLNHISETALSDYKKFSAIVDNSVPDLNILKGKVQDIIRQFKIM